MFSAPDFRTNTFQEKFVPDNMENFASRGRVVIPASAYSKDEYISPIGKSKADFIAECTAKFEKEAEKAES